jgi:divalent metal cation (Fe/Co/Zn/Cd) transporter
LVEGARDVPGQDDELRRRATRLEWFTVTWNVLEALVALGAGYLAGSIALEGFGLDSVIETISGLTLLWRFRARVYGTAGEQAAERRAVRVVGMTFFALAAYVGYEGGADLWFRRAAHFSLPGVILATASLIVMPILGLAKRRTARALESRALAADSVQTLVCSYLSAILLGGLLLNGWLHWWWADPAAALAIAAAMVGEGLEAFSS